MLSRLAIKTLVPGSPFRFAFRQGFWGRGNLSFRALLQARYCRYGAQHRPLGPSAAAPRPNSSTVPTQAAPRRLPSFAWIFSSSSPQSETRYRPSRTLFAQMEAFSLLSVSQEHHHGHPRSADLGPNRRRLPFDATKVEEIEKPL